MSDSVRPHRRQPTRLPRPWDSPGKNTGVGCHFLLQCMKVKVKSLSRVRLLATPWTAVYQAPLSMGFSRQEYWSGVPLPSPLVVLNSLNFCMSGKLFISPSILNEILAGYSNLGCRFFPFSTLNISCHSLLACRVSAVHQSESIICIHISLLF